MKRKEELKVEKFKTELNDLGRMNRRTFVKVAGITAGALALGNLRLIKLAQAQQGTPLPGTAIPQFREPLPTLAAGGGTMQTVIADANEITLTMREFKAKILPTGTFTPGVQPETSVWGYIVGQNAPPAALDTYIGPVIVATRDLPTQIRYVNNLGNTAGTNVIAWKESTDQTLHWADPANLGHVMTHYDGPIPAVPHLHGGEVPPVLDGGPDAWFLSSTTTPAGYTQKGHAFYTSAVPGVVTQPNEAVYRYPNKQEAAPLWFHDHVLGATRLNVYAGIAGAYPLIDPNLVLPTGLHPVGLKRDTVDFIVPLVIQDRMFDTNGQLFFPNVGINPEHPFWIPEFVGDVIVVNGKAWPFFNVAPKRYRFLFLNGSNARAYELFLDNPVTKVMGPAMHVIATDGGYLDNPVKIDPNAPKGQLQRLVILPGERYDVIIDFAGLPAGTRLLLRNVAKTPFPAGAAPMGNTVGRVMEFRVNQPFTGPDTSYDPASGISLRPPIKRLVDPATGTLGAGVVIDKFRQLTLNEVIGAGGPLEILVNNTRWNGIPPGGTPRADFTPVTVNGVTEYFSELPEEGKIEQWEIINLTADAHPIHTHLTQFQLRNRQSFDVAKYNADYASAFGGAYVPAFGPPLNYNTGNPNALGGNPDVNKVLGGKTVYLMGPAMPPQPNEAGWKDTVIMLPGQVTRIVVRYAPTDTPIGTPGTYPFDPNAPVNPADPSTAHGFVWHCHIIDHEDNEMMRPSRVTPTAGATRTYIQRTDY